MTRQPTSAFVYGGIVFFLFRSPFVGLAGLLGYLSHLVADGGRR